MIIQMLMHLDITITELEFNDMLDSKVEMIGDQAMPEKEKVDDFERFSNNNVFTIKGGGRLLSPWLHH